MASARLLIHVNGGLRGGGWLVSALGVLRSLVPDALRRRRRVPTGVQIDDLHGRQFFAAEDARSLIDVPLPAGTYHVTARLGDVRRRYTVTLQSGATFDLRLRLASDRQ